MDGNTSDCIQVYSRTHSLVYLPLECVARRSVRPCAFRRCAKRAFYTRLTSALDPHETPSIKVTQASTVDIHYRDEVYIRKCGGKRAARLPRSMKVKVVQWSEPHVMRVLSFPTPERTHKTTSNDVKARGLKEEHAPSYGT